jgi:hypothetical protein
MGKFLNDYLDDLTREVDGLARAVRAKIEQIAIAISMTFPNDGF